MKAPDRQVKVWRVDLLIHVSFFVHTLSRQFDIPSPVPPEAEPDSIAQLLEESDLDFDTKRWLQREYTR